MRKFRVYDTVKKEMYYEGFLLSNDGELYKIDKELTVILAQALPVKKVTSFSMMDCMEANTFKTVRFQPSEEQRYIVQYELNRVDRQTSSLYEGDIIRYESGYEYVLIYGKFGGMFCPGDKRYTTGQGFVACEYDDKDIITTMAYPISEVEELSICIGNICTGYKIVSSGMSRKYVKKKLFEEELSLKKKEILIDPKKKLYSAMKANFWSDLFSTDQFEFLKRNITSLCDYLVDKQIDCSIQAFEDAINIYDDNRVILNPWGRNNTKWKVILMLSMEAVYKEYELEKVSSSEFLKKIKINEKIMERIHEALIENLLENDFKFCYNNRITADWLNTKYE